MLLGVYIIVDDDYGSPIYADPAPGDLDDGVWEKVCEIIEDVLDGDRESRGNATVGEAIVAWRSMVKSGMTFVAAITDDLRAQHAELYLQKLAKRYADEVDDLRSPDKDGVADVVVDVIPPWEEDGG